MPLPRYQSRDHGPPTILRIQRLLGCLRHPDPGFALGMGHPGRPAQLGRGGVGLIWASARAQPPTHPSTHPTLPRVTFARVTFASPQSAPTAPATTVLIALTSVCDLVFIAFSFRCSSVGARVQGPCPPLSTVQVRCRLWCCGAANIRTPYA